MQNHSSFFIGGTMCEKSFKERVKEAAIANANLYEINLIGYEYLVCSSAFATSDNKFTLGFASSGRPKSLLKGNELDKSKYKDVDLVFRKVRSSGQPYTDLYYGKREDIVKYQEQIKGFLVESFFE